MNRRSLSSFALVLATALSPMAALAQSAPTTISPAIEAEHQQGMALRAAHQDEAARAIFERIWNRIREPRARARQALAEQSLGQFANAETHMVEALSFRDDPWIRQNRTVLEPILQQARARQGISVLQISCSAPGAEVFVNGSSAGRAGEPVRVAPGSVTFEVRAPGFARVSRTVQLQPGATESDEITLVRAEQPGNNGGTGTSNSSGNGNGGNSGNGSGTVVVVPPVVEASGPNGATIAAVLLGGIGLAGGAGGLIPGLIIGGNAAERWNRNGQCGDQAHIENNPPDCQEILRTVRSMEVLNVVSAVGGGVLIATSVALFVVSATQRPPARSTAFMCGPGNGLTSVVCGGTF